MGQTRHRVHKFDDIDADESNMLLLKMKYMINRKVETESLKIYTSPHFEGEYLTPIELNLNENLNEIDDFNDLERGFKQTKGIALPLCFF